MPAAGGGMFGSTPQEVYQQQQQGINQSALDMAKMDGLTAAKYSMGQLGGALAAPIAGMMGMKNPQMDAAQQSKDIQSQIDHSTPEGLMKGAQLFNQAGNPRMAMMYQQAAQAMIAQKAELENKAAQTEVFRRQATAKPSRGKATPISNDYGDTTVIWGDGTREDLGRIGKTKQQGSTAAVGKPTYKDDPEGNTWALYPGREPELVGKFGKVGGLTPREKAAQEKNRSKIKIELGTLDSGFNTLQSNFDAFKKRAIDVRDSPGMEMATGMSGYAAGWWGGSEGAKTKSDLKSLKNLLAAEGLTKLRQSGGIGAITEKEWGILADQVANIDPVALGKEGTEKAINNAIAEAERILNNAKYDVEAKRKSYEDVLNDGTGDKESAPPEITTQAQFDALPSGAKFIEDGVVRMKD